MALPTGSKRSFAQKSFSLQAIGLMAAAMVFPSAASSSSVSTVPLLLVSGAIQAIDAGGKPSLEEIRWMNFTDSVRLDSAERAGNAQKKMNQHAASVKAGESDCLATAKSDGTCLVTVGTLNRRIATSTGKTGFPDSYRNSPDSIAVLRRALVSEELAESFASFLFEGKIANPYIEEVELEWKKELSRKEKEIGQRKLRAIYQDYLSVLNLAQARYASVIGSSDSAVLDSLLAGSLDSVWGGPRRNRISGSPDETKPVWSRVELDLLPAELSKTLDTLPSDVPSPIQRTKIGWFSCAIRKPVHSPISYAEALPLLIEIASRGGSVKNVLPGYDPQNDAPEDPDRGIFDSVPVKIWLAPNERMRSGRLVSGLKAIDTSAFKPFSARFSDLPRPMQFDIRRTAANRAGVVLSNPLGRWFIRFTAPLPRSSRPVSGKNASSGQNAMTAVLDAFARDVLAKNHGRKLSLYQSFAGNGDAAFVAALRDDWIKNQVEINRDLIDQKP